MGWVQQWTPDIAQVNDQLKKPLASLKSAKDVVEEQDIVHQGQVVGRLLPAFLVLVILLVLDFGLEPVVQFLRVPDESAKREAAT